MFKKIASAFTLIELMVVISIIALLSLVFYSPYSYQQKKSFLNTGTRELSQSILDARNLAMNGLDTGSGNVNVGLYFSSGATQIIYLTSKDVFDVSNILGTSEVYQEKSFPQGVQVDSINGISGERFIYFSAISGEEHIYPSDTQFLSGEIDFQLSLQGSTSSLLQKQLHYYTRTHISDY